MSSLPVKPEFGPTLPELAAPLWRRAPWWMRLAVAAVAALVVLAALVVAVRGGVGAGDTSVVVREPVAYNLRYGSGLSRAKATGGDSLRLEARRGGLFLQSFAVRSLTLPPYRGEPSGVLPVIAEALKARLARRFAEFELISEGRARINDAPGYEVVFRARSGARRLYGRWTMLLWPDEPGVRDGVMLELLGTPAAGIATADDIGKVGQLKLPLRSFRFGTEAP